MNHNKKSFTPCFPNWFLPLSRPLQPNICNYSSTFPNDPAGVPQLNTVCLDSPSLLTFQHYYCPLRAVLQAKKEKSLNTS